MKFIHETWILFKHYMRASIRNPIWLVVALFQPICYLLLFAPVLQGISDSPGFPKGGALNVFTPGLLVMLSLYGTMFVGFAMIDDLKAGVIERLRVSPVGRLSILMSRAFRDVFTQIIQSIIIVLVAIPLGLKMNVIGTLVALSLMGMIGFIMAPCSYALSLTLKSEESVGSIVNLLAQPMILLSGILLPLTIAPRWIQIVGAINPLTYIVNASRLLFNGMILNYDVLRGVIILVVLSILSVIWAARSFNKVLE